MSSWDAACFPACTWIAALGKYIPASASPTSAISKDVACPIFLGKCPPWGPAGPHHVCNHRKAPSARARWQWEGDGQISIQQELHGVQSWDAFTSRQHSLMWALWEPPCDPAGCAGAGTPKAGIMSRAQLPAHPIAAGKGLALSPSFLSATELSILPSP